MERGIVVCPTKFEVFKDGFSVSPGLSADDLRYFVLYWDKLAIPTDNFIHVGVQDEDFLVSAGVLERPETQFTGSFYGSDMAIAAIESYAKVAEEKKDDKKTDWVIHQFSTDLIVPESVKASNQILRLDLFSALPVPSDIIPMSELLEFKSKRLDEFQALHECIDDIYFEILSSPDQSLSSKKCLSRLESAIRDLETSQKERFSFFKKFDFSIETDGSQLFDLAPAVAGLYADFASGGAALGVPSLFGAVVSARSCLKVSTKPGDFFTSAKGKNKLAYLSGARKEGVLKL